MKAFVQQLNKSSIDALQSAIGKNIGFLFPYATLSVNHEGVTTGSISVSLDHKSYLIIENDWADTPVGAIDYFSINASLSDTPKDIHVTDHSGSGWLHHNPSTIHTWAPTVVSKIEVYEYLESFEDESVQYDSALLFDYETGKMLLSREESIAAGIEINWKPVAIREIIETMVLRLVLE